MNMELSQKIQSYTPEQCANLVTRPSSEVYYALKQLIHKSDPPWIRSFVDHSGLIRLVDTLVLLSQDRQKMPWTSVCDAILQLDCIGCVREVMNVNEGMEYLVDNGGLVEKLVLALDTPNVYPKKQLFELLTCVTLATEQGHQSVLNALQYYKKVKHQAHEFTIIIHEIKLAENTHYRTTLLAFINALIQCTSNLRDRCRIRNHFIGLKILDVINFMKKDEKDAEFCVQMQLFYTGKQSDEAELLQLHHMDVYNPQHIFHAISDNLVGTPEMSNFLHVLQDLYRMNSTSSDRSLLWKTLEKVTYTVSNIQTDKESLRFLSHLYSTLESGISNDLKNNNVVDEEICENSFNNENNINNINKIPMNEDELIEEMLSGSPEMKFVKNLDNKFPHINEDGEYNDRRDSGVSMRSCSSPNTGCYSDYDNIDENSIPLSDVFIQQPYLPSRGKYPPSKEFHHQYHSLPAIEETEMDCIDEETENTNRKNIERSKYPVNDNQKQNSAYSSNDNELIRPTSLEIVKRTVKIKAYPGETSRIDNFNVASSHHKTGDRLSPSGSKPGILRTNSNNGNKEVSLFKKMCQDKMSANTNNNSNQRSTTCSITKEVKWVRVPDTKARMSMSMWSQMNEYGNQTIPVDFTRLQREFVDKTPQTLDGAEDELSLLNPDSSLALNLFLARLETNPDFVAGCVKEGEVEELGVEAVRHLLQVLPSEQEIKQVRKYTVSGGSLYDLAPPDQLLTLLSSIPGYRLQLDALVFHTQFTQKFCRLHEAFDSLLKACRDVINCHRLRDFMKCALRVGNFLNKDTNTGKVDGVALASWQRMAQVTSSCNHDNLLTWVIKHICDTDESVLLFMNDLPTLKSAASCDIEEMKSEVNELNLQMKKFVSKLTVAPSAIAHKYDKILEGVTKDLHYLQEQIQGVKYASSQLMAYLCEEEATFDVQKCLKTLHEFVVLVQTLKKDSVDRDTEGQLAGMRVKQMIDQQIDQYFADIFTGNDVTLSATPSLKHKSSRGLVDKLLEKLHQGNVESNYLDSHQGADYKHLQSFVMPEHKEERFSPDREVAPEIPLHSTPSKADESVLEIPELRDLGQKKTYADRADNHIKQQYRKDNQALSSSFVSPKDPSSSQCKDKLRRPVDPVTRSVPGNRDGHHSQYDNFQDMDVILMDLDTCVDKVNHEIQKLENAKKAVKEHQQQPEKTAITTEHPVVDPRGDSNNGSGVKFFFGLPTPNELKPNSENLQQVKGEKSKVAGNLNKGNVNKTDDEKDKENDPTKEEPTTTANTANIKPKPASKLGILKRFSKAVLRQRDGNIVTTNTETTKPSSLKRPTSDPVYSNKAASKPVTRHRSTDGTTNNPTARTIDTTDKTYPVKEDPSDEKIGSGKENTNSKYQLRRFGFGSLKEQSNKQQPDQNKPKKLTKSLSSELNSAEFVKRGSLKKTNSIPCSGARGRNESETVKNRSESDRFLDTKGPDRRRKFNAARDEVDFPTSSQEMSRDRAGSMPAFTRRNGIPTTRGRSNNFSAKQIAAAETALQKSSSDTVIANRSADDDPFLEPPHHRRQQTSQYVPKEITIKPSYSLSKDEEVTDRILDSKNIQYRSSSLPVQKQTRPSAVPKPTSSVSYARDKKANTVQVTSNRFGFGRKEKKGASERGSIGGAAVIPSAPKHELQQAEKCTLKIYRKYTI